MSREETALQLIQLIYEAADGTAPWSGFLEAFASSLGGGAAFLTLEHPGRSPSPSIVTHGLDPTAVESYATHFVTIDPHQKPISAEPEGLVEFGEPYVPRNELERTEIYNDWYRPNGLSGDSIGGVVLRRGNLPSVLGAYQEKRQAVYKTEDLELARILMPHIKRALQIHYQLDSSQRQAATFWNALEGLATGVVVLDESGRVVEVNRRARELTRDGNALVVTRDSVRCRRTEDSRTLGRAIESALAAARGEGLGSGGALHVARPLPEPPLHVIVTPLATGERVGERGAAVGLFISDPENLPSLPAQPLRNLFRLTPREADIASAISEGKSLAETAEALEISLHTVKARLQDIFAKTETNRQTDLVRLLSALAVTCRQ